MGKGGGGGKSAAKGKRGKTAEGKGARVGLWKSGGQQGGGGGWQIKKRARCRRGWTATAVAVAAVAAAVSAATARAAARAGVSSA